MTESTTDHARPLVIGLTGGIASGKSSVSAHLAQQGVHVIDADKVGHRVIAPDGPAYRPVIEAFGADIVAADGTIDRARLGALVFAERNRLKELEGISHPRMLALVREEIATIRAGDPAAQPPLILLDAAILFEAGWDALCDGVWAVVTEPERAVERLIARNGLTREQAEARQAAQLSNAERTARADRVLHNDGSLDELYAETDRAYAAAVGLEPPRETGQPGR